MTDLATFCGTYSDWKLIRTRSVVQIIFEVPLEASGDAYRVLGGMPQPSKEVWCAIARLQDKQEAETSSVAIKPASEIASPVRADHDTRLAKQAGRKCKELLFQAFLYEHDMATEKSEASAATAVRLICHVKSRSEIIPGTPAADEWERLYSKFVVWKIAA